MKNNELQQQRLTLEDAMKAQMELLRFVRRQIDTEPHYITSEEEKEQYFQLLSMALLSQGPMGGVQPRAKWKNKDGMVMGEIILGSDVHHFGLKLMDVRKTPTYLITSTGKHLFRTITLWKILYGYLMELVSKAQAEALSRSKERELFEHETADYKFDAHQRIKEY